MELIAEGVTGGLGGCGAQPKEKRNRPRFERGFETCSTYRRLRIVGRCASFPFDTLKAPGWKEAGFASCALLRGSRCAWPR